MAANNPGFFKRFAQKVIGSSASGGIKTTGQPSQTQQAADAALAQERARQAQASATKKQGNG